MIPSKQTTHLDLRFSGLYIHRHMSVQSRQPQPVTNQCKLNVSRNTQLKHIAHDCLSNTVSLTEYKYTVLFPCGRVELETHSSGQGGAWKSHTCTYLALLTSSGRPRDCTQQLDRQACSLNSTSKFSSASQRASGGWTRFKGYLSDDDSVAPWI